MAIYICAPSLYQAFRRSRWWFKVCHVVITANGTLTIFCFSNEDDITVVLSDIAMANTVIKAGLAKGTNTQTLMVHDPHTARSDSV